MGCGAVATTEAVGHHGPMPETAVTKLARRIAAVAVLAVLAYPPATTAVVHWVADHDMVDVPYVRDCHGLYRRPAECPSAAGRPAPANGASGLRG
jgi:hypothetical protein